MSRFGIESSACNATCHIKDCKRRVRWIAWESAVSQKTNQIKSEKFYFCTPHWRRFDGMVIP